MAVGFVGSAGMDKKRWMSGWTEHVSLSPRLSPSSSLTHTLTDTTNADTPQNVTTDPATNVSYHNATLNGHYDGLQPPGHNLSYYYEYGAHVLACLISIRARRCG